MRERTNPLDKIKIASPCSANWDEMYGNERKRFCAECRLNVYNVAEMTRDEAENFILRSEGRLCLRIYKRRDGTVITRDCPVGWARVKRRVRRVGAAILSLAGGFLSGIIGIASLRTLAAFTDYKEVPEIFFKTKQSDVSLGLYAGASNLPEVKKDIGRKKKQSEPVTGQVERTAPMGESLHMSPFQDFR